MAQYPYIPDLQPGACAHLTTGAVASAETGAASDGSTVYWFLARTTEAAVIFGKAGAVTTPTMTNGWPCPINIWTPYRVPPGLVFKAIATGAGDLAWFQNAPA